MYSPDVAYAINEPAVIHECVEGEVLVVDLKRGAYFSLVESAAFIWDALAAGATPGAIAAALAVRHAVDIADVESAVVTFVTDLVSEGLIVPGRAAPGDAWTPPAGDAGPFVAPLLARYTDIEDHMQVDPVHEVGERGWPHQDKGN